MNFKNSIRKKILLLAFSLTLVLTIGTGIFIGFKIIPSIRNLEEKAAVETSSMEQKAIEAEEINTLLVAKDYGEGDGTKNVILNNTLAKNYFKINFSPSSLKNYNLSFVCLYDNNFKQIYGVEKEKDTLNTNFIFDLASNYKVGVYTYYCNFDEKNQILTRLSVSEVTDPEGELKTKTGYLLLGQNLTLKDFAKINTEKQISLRIIGPEEIAQNQKPYFFQIKNKEIISYFALNNTGNNNFFIKITQDAKFYLDLSRSEIGLIVGTYLAFLLLTLFITGTLEKFVFKRLNNINEETKAISLDNFRLITPDLSFDEIGELRNSIAKMLNKIKEETDVNKKIENKLRETEVLWSKFLMAFNDPFWVKDEKGRYVAVNNSCLKNENYGKKEEEVLEKTDFDFCSQEIALARQKTDEIAKQVGIFEEETLSDDNNKITYLTKKISVYDRGKYLGLIGMARDISELKNNEAKLLRKERILKATTKLQQEIISSNDKKDIYEILVRNLVTSLAVDRVQIFEKVFDESSNTTYMQRQAVKGLNVFINLYKNDKFFESVVYSEKAFGDWLPKLEKNKKIILNTTAAAPEEKEILERYGIKTIVVLPIFVKRKLFGQLSIEALTERTWTTEELSLLEIAQDVLALSLEKYYSMKDLEISNFHDGLTGLYNRKFYEERAKKIFSNARNYPISILIGDLDGLKMTNDTLGHKEGDTAIINAAKCLVSVFRKDDIVARIGGDEFAILLPNTSAEKAAEITKRVLKENKKMNGELITPFNISLGYATQKYPEDVFERVGREADNFMYSNKMKNDQSSKNNMISSLFLILISKDATAEAHSNITSEITAKFAKFLGMGETKIEELKLFAKFHDIGKVGILEGVLLKKGKLTPEEFEEVKRHSEIGYKLTKFVPYLAFASEWILRHHERWDGTGYPGKLAGEAIPFESRLIMLVDAYESMTSDNKSYKSVKTKAEAIAEITKCSGTQFDPALATAFIAFLNLSLN